MRKKPYGHSAYTRKTKSGKLAHVSARGVKPAKAKDHPLLPHLRDNPAIWSGLRYLRAKGGIVLRGLTPPEARAAYLTALEHGYHEVRRFVPGVDREYWAHHTGSWSVFVPDPTESQMSNSKPPVKKSTKVPEVSKSSEQPTTEKSLFPAIIGPAPMAVWSTGTDELIAKGIQEGTHHVPPARNLRLEREKASGIATKE